MVVRNLTARRQKSAPVDGNWQLGQVGIPERPLRRPPHLEDGSLSMIRRTNVAITGDFNIGLDLTISIIPLSAHYFT